MKELPKFAIVALAAFVLGFSAQSLLGTAMRKARNRVFLAESERTLGDLRARIAAYKASKGGFPGGPADLKLDPADPPLETLRREARWVRVFDGGGGFLYLSGTGEIYLNVDLSREKFTRADWKRLKEGKLLPKGGLY